jgi:two-component system, LytTR family, sensor kinase
MRTFFLKQVTSLVGGFLFLAIVDFALGSLTYFSLQLLGFPTPSGSDGSVGSAEFRYVLIGNLAESAVALVLYRLFRLYEGKLGRSGWRVGVLLLQIYVAIVLLDYVLFAPQFSWAAFWRDLFYLHPLEALFQSHILIAVFLLYRVGLANQRSQREREQQEVEILQLKQLKTKAELDALQARVNPHFLHNALNSVASLIHPDPDRAEQMVLLLSKFYRYSTGQKSDGHFAQLGEELDMVSTYLAVEQIRFGERLVFGVEVADDALRRLEVPRFLLQPLVENAIKHGVAKTVGPAHIRLRAWAQAGQAHFAVVDSGPAFPVAPRLGYGLQGLQDRLQLLYGTRASLTLLNQPEKHVLVSIPLPA